MRIQTQSFHLVIETLRVRWRLHWGVLITCMITIVVCVALSHWQWQRGQQKAHQQQALIQQSQQFVNWSTPVSLPSQYAHVQLTGEFFPEKNWIIEGRSFNQQMGFVVYTLFKMKTDKKYLIIERGWQSYSPNTHDQRDIVLSPFKTNGKISGLVYYPKKPLSLSIRKQRVTPLKKGPQFIPSLNLNTISQETGLTIHPYIIVLDDGQPAALQKQFNPITITPARHYSYAVQWLTFAMIAFVVTIAMGWQKRDETEA